MTDVLIVCAAEDTAAAQFLCERLSAAGYVAGIALADGPRMPEVTAALAVLWSPRSAARSDLIRLGEAALADGRLISLGMENMRPETALGHEPWIDLTGWTGREDFPAWRSLVAEVSRRVGLFAVAGPPPVAPPPPAMQVPPPSPPITAPPIVASPPPAALSPTPEAPAAPVPPIDPPPASMPPPYAAPPPSYGASPSPPPTASAGGFLAQVPASALLVGALAFVMLLIAGVAGFYWVRDQNAAREMRAGFERLDREDPAALREFIEENPRSRQVADARAALDTLERRRFEEASASNDQAKLRAFLAAFPNSARRQEAMNRISEIQALEAAAAASRAQLPGQLPPATGPFTDGGTGLPPAPAAPNAPQPGAAEQGPRSLRPPAAAPAPTAPPAPPAAEDDFEAMLRQGQQDQRIQPTR